MISDIRVLVECPIHSMFLISYDYRHKIVIRKRLLNPIIGKIDQFRVRI